MADVLAPVDLRPLPLAKLDRSFARSGVYFLFQGQEIVYVGQSADVLRRIGEHISDRLKVFDGVAFIPCQALNRVWMEEQYIKRLKPRYNGLTEHEARQASPHFRSRRRGRSRVRIRDVA